jgi:glycosyltransferase involved in cell wall biosynthesis
MNLQTGGVSTHRLEIASMFKKMGHNVIVVSGGGEYALQLQEIGVKHYYIPFHRLKKNPLLFIPIAKAFYDVVKDNDIDIIDCHWSITCLFSHLMFKLFNIPYVWTCHIQGIPSGGYYKYLRFYGLSTICVGSELKEELMVKHGIDSRRIHVVYNSLDPEKYQPLQENEKRIIRNKFNIIKGDRVITILSRIVPYKRHMDLLKCLKELVFDYNYKNLKVIFAGDALKSCKDDLIEFIETNNLQKYVIFAGYQRPRDVLGITDIFVLPSDVEGFSIACSEAMAMGVPVIRTMTGGWEDMRDCCLAFKPGDIKMLSHWLREVLNHDSIASELKHKGFEFVNKNLKIEKEYEALYRIYSQLVASKNKH